MLTSPTLLNSAPTGSQTGSVASLSNLSDDYTKFLTLLTAQISNQDPLKPVDSTQFISQLAQLSQVEQAVKSNQQLETLTTQISGLINVSGTDLLGRQVAVESNTVMLSEGQTTTVYELEGPAVSVTARITDPLGRVVRTMNGMPNISGQEIELGWDGLDDNGNPVLDGQYRVTISAKNDEGKSVGVDVTRLATVEEVRFHEGELLFGVTGGETVSSVTVRAAR